MAKKTGQNIDKVEVRKENKKNHKIEHQWYNLFYWYIILLTNTIIIITYNLNSRKHTGQVVIRVALKKRKDTF